MNSLLQYTWRHYLVFAVLIALAGTVVFRMAWLQVYNKQFYIDQGEARMQRVDNISANRGMIVDRRGEPLAVSSPVTTIWGDPKLMAPSSFPELAAHLDIPLANLQKRYKAQIGKESRFMYLKRRMIPSYASSVLSHKIPGVEGYVEYKRYYPAGEVVSGVVGLTNIDDIGQEGAELTFNSALVGEPGKKRVLKDLYGNVVRDVESIQSVSPGANLQLTIDMRLQFLAYKELKNAVAEFGAHSGSAIIMDVESGEVLALVNQPSFNPNDRAGLQYDQMRNRVVTDAFEPGSVVKPLTLAAALESGKFTESMVFNTAPGFLRLNSHTIRDAHNYGELTFEEILTKSSNIGTSKIAMELGAENLWNKFYGFGLGQLPGIGLPGEAPGSLPNRASWKNIELATFSYGYGLTVTPLQLAAAYGAIANQGLRVEPSIVSGKSEARQIRVLSERNADRMKAILEKAVVSGTGKKSQSKLYRIAGKTGTVHKLVNGRYSDDKYIASFAGFAPVSNPKLVMVVSIDDPVGEKYYGGEVAAPVFGRIMEAALQIQNVAPDKNIENVELNWEVLL